MKTLLSILFITISMLCKADGIDRIHVYLNGELIHRTESFEEQKKQIIKVGDTLIFEAWTDWSRLEGATLTIQDKENGIDETLTQMRNAKYGAQFIYIVAEKDLKGDLEIILNYNIREFVSNYFLTIHEGTL